MRVQSKMALCFVKVIHALFIFLRQLFSISSQKKKHFENTNFSFSYFLLGEDKVTMNYTLKEKPGTMFHLTDEARYKWKHV